MTGGPRPFWSRFVPDRIASQIAVLVFLSVASLHAVILVYVVWSRQGAPIRTRPRPQAASRPSSRSSMRLPPRRAPNS